MLRLRHCMPLCPWLTVKCTISHARLPKMVILNFTLSEEGVAVLHDALACMFKFSDDVCLEARKDKVATLPTE